MLTFSQRWWWGHIHLVIGKTGVRLQNKPGARTYCCSGLDQQPWPFWPALPYLGRSRWNIEIMDKGKEPRTISVLCLLSGLSWSKCLAGRRLCIRRITPVVRWTSREYWIAPKLFGRCWQWKGRPAWTCPRYTAWVAVRLDERIVPFNSICSAIQTCHHGSGISTRELKNARTC